MSGVSVFSERPSLTLDQLPNRRNGHWAQIVGLELQIPVTERAQEYADDILESATKIATERGRSLETTIVTGEPDHRIVAQAEDESIDLTVSVATDERRFRVSCSEASRKKSFVDHRFPSS